MNKRTIQKEATRLKIITTSKEYYAEKGFLVSTAVIAKEAEISHGTIFAHFPTSDALILAVIQHFCESIATKLRNISAKNGSTAFLSQHLEVLTEHESFYKRLIEEKTILPEESQLLFVKIQSTISHNFSKVVDLEQASIKDIPLHLQFNTWIGLVHYYLSNSALFSPNYSVLTQHKDELLFLYTELIKK